MNEQVAIAVAAFNAEQYRDALLAFERRWHAERSETLRALILLCNAMNQLRLGLAEGPRRNLARAAALLDDAPTHYEGIALAPLRAQIARLRTLLPTGAAAPSWAQVPRCMIEWPEAQAAP